MEHIDWAGVATVIGAVGAFLTVLAGLAMQIINFRDQRRARHEQSIHKDMLENITQKLNAGE